jgi:PAS domain S-box-containing protein
MSKRGTDGLADQVVAVMDGGIVLAHGFDGVITHRSAGCEELYGWTRKEAVGQAVHNLFGATFLAPKAAIHAHLRRDGRWTGEAKRLHKNGHQLHVISRLISPRGGHALLNVATIRPGIFVEK